MVTFGLGSALARTLIIQPDRLCREGLTRILGEMREVRLLPSAASAEEALSSCRSEPPDLVLTEIDLPDMDGLDLIGRLVELQPRPLVIVLSRQGGHAYVTAAMARGAEGYVLRSSSADDLKEALLRVMSGQPYIQPSLASALMGRRLGPQRENELSERECTCLIHLSRGATNQEIARAVYLGEKTIRNILTRLFQKLGARNRTEAVSLGREFGYL